MSIIVYSSNKQILGSASKASIEDLFHKLIFELTFHITYYM